MNLITQSNVILWTLSSIYSYSTQSVKETLDLDLLLKGMTLFFEEEDKKESIQKKYKKEMYPIYTSIVSDYKEYQRWEEYNKKVWFSFQKKELTSLIQKIKYQLQHFFEGMHLYSLMKV